MDAEELRAAEKMRQLQIDKSEASERNWGRLWRRSFQVSVCASTVFLLSLVIFPNGEAQGPGLRFRESITKISSRAGQPASPTCHRARSNRNLSRIFNHTYDQISPWDSLEKVLGQICFWQDPVWLAYKALHHRMQLQEQAPRYIIFDATEHPQGFGSLLAGLEFCFYAAMFAGRALLVDWREPIDVEKIFAPREVDWRLRSHPHVLRLHESQTQHMDVFNMLEVSVKPVMTALRSNMSALVIRSNFGVGKFVRRFHFERLGSKWKNLTLRSWLRPWSKFKGCAFHSLFRLLPDGDLARLWSRIDRTVPPGVRLGLHLRLGDSAGLLSYGPPDERQVLGNKDWGLRTAESSTSQSVECLQQIAAQMGIGAPCVIIFESDSIIAKKTAVETGHSSHCRGPCTVWASGFSPQHSQEPNESAGLETWLSLVMLSAVEALLFSTGSFGPGAGYLGPALVNTQHRLANFDDFLKERFRLKIGREDLRDLCSFSRQPNDTDWQFRKLPL